MHHLFLDESGNHSLTAFEPAYPVFVLGGVIIADADLKAVDEAVRAFKRDALGDECVVLHTADIARNRRGFEMLADGAQRSRFHRELNELMRSLPFAVVAFWASSSSASASHLVRRKRRVKSPQRAEAADSIAISSWPGICCG